MAGSTNADRIYQDATHFEIHGGEFHGGLTVVTRE